MLSFKPSYILNKFIDFTNFVNLFFDIYHYWKTLSNIRNLTESLFPITFFAIFGIFVLKRLTLCSNYKSAQTISTGIFYRPPNVNTFLETFLNDLKLIDFTKSEVYFLGDFNSNLLQNNKFVLKENQPLDSKNLNPPLLPKYKELCQTFSLKELIQEPTRVTSSTSSLLDHILRNSGWKVSQKGVIDVGLSDHQLIYCTRKIVRAKTNVHNQIRVRSLKNYTQEILLEE